VVDAIWLLISRPRYLATSSENIADDVVRVTGRHESRLLQRQAVRGYCRYGDGLGLAETLGM